MSAAAQVSVVSVGERATAVRAARTTWAQFPQLWRPLLDEVHANVRWQGGERPGHNVMLYRDVAGGADVEVGVLLNQPAEVAPPVIRSVLPAGTAAWIEHTGPFTELGRSHAALRAWCAERNLVTAGTRWEVYGHHDDDPSRQRTDIYCLLAG